MSSVSLNHIRGRTYVRGLILRSAGLDDRDNMREIAAARWGEHQADAIVRSAVTPLTSTDLGDDPAMLEFMGLVREGTIYGRLSGLRKVPFLTRLPRITTGAVGHWVGEAKPKPMSKPAVLGSSIGLAKIVALIATTDEALRHGGRLVEDALQNDLVRAVGAVWDEALLDPANDGEPGVRPAALTNGVPTIAATSNPTADIKALIAAFRGDFASAYFILSPETAVHLAQRRTGTAFEFADLGPRGGSILGIPVLTSRNVPDGLIALIDPSGIAAADDTVSIIRAQHATLQMTDDPESGATELVSLWQTNTVAFRAEVATNWEMQRPGSVAVITGADYSAGL